MKSERRSIWLRVLAEGVAIVASILLAFGIQAWWEGRRDRVEERVALAGLRQEFAGNLDQLNAGASSYEKSLRMTRRLLALSRADSLAPNPLAMDSLIRIGWLDYGTFNPGQGVLTALVTSGDIGLIRDARLREAIGAWSGMLDDLVEEELMMARDSQERWAPALQARIQLSSVYAVSGEQVPEGRRPDYRKILGDQLLENYLWERIDNTRYVLADYARLHALIEEIIELSDGSLR